MFVQRIESHVAIIAVLLLIGVPTNMAVIWIHTRKNSRVARNKFALIFAAIDLIAMLVAVPCTPIRDLSSRSATQQLLFEIHNGANVWLLNGYVSTLLLATIDKFYAVSYPFMYQAKHQFFLKTALVLAFGLNLLPTTAVLAARIIRQKIHGMWTVFVYNIVLSLAFLVTIVLFLAIATKLVHNSRKLRKSGPTETRLVLNHVNLIVYLYASDG